MKKTIRLGTRKSPLAIVQTERVKRLLMHQFPDTAVDIVPVSTTGDLDKQTPLDKLGGRGVFIKGLEQALLDDDIDIAVHSFKDVTSKLEPGCVLSGFLKPETQSDCLVFASKEAIEDTGKKLIVGTGSARRKQWLAAVKPAWECMPIRGNVETRLKAVGKTVDAVMLSYAGLLRLELEPVHTEVLDPLYCIPAPGQGVICLETRQVDTNLASMCSDISDTDQTIISLIEFELLKGLAFDCSIPLGVYSAYDHKNRQVTIHWTYSKQEGEAFRACQGVHHIQLPEALFGSPNTWSDGQKASLVTDLVREIKEA